MDYGGSKRILITGLSSWWGGRLAQVLEQEPGVEAVIGVDSSDPKHALERTEFVRVELEEGVLGRIITATGIDTVIDTRLIADPLLAPLGKAREINVKNTRIVLEACTAPCVRKLVFKSSGHYYGSDSEDPSFFGEEMRRTRSPSTAIERDIVEAEGQIAEFAARNPGAITTVLRVADALVGEPGSSHLALLSLPVVPSILGFDPRVQFVHDDDVIGAFGHAVRNDLPGTYNVAADGVLALSEVVSLLGKPLLPILPPWGLAFGAAQLRRLGLRVPVEMIRHLRYGRGVDNRRLKATGYQYRYTSRETVLKLRAHQRLRPLLRSGGDGYRYDREVEEFLRRSPSVRSAPAAPHGTARADHAPADHATADHPEAELTEAELIDVISSLDSDALLRLRSHEQALGARPQVLAALDHNLAQREARRAPEQDRGH